MLIRIIWSVKNMGIYDIAFDRDCTCSQNHHKFGIIFDQCASQISQIWAAVWHHVLHESNLSKSNISWYARPSVRIPHITACKKLKWKKIFIKLVIGPVQMDFVD